ncbi:MFS transporter [Chryseobacterium indologenes]|uniref:MFS transporter n=1 Tax=Chryseobacterium indologenes TaxID=253 RepID=UPI000BFB26CE|nr:MFS transporter [Chryseobacterium indologenes]ATN04660.1 MFS transporter [Chryseobacterium indologenes]AYY86588.1 MFS transporter [Chryseobacterium indologenes]AYZ36467.1 MFS transporter [Chryseobacterium indologenes]MBF6645143.1 MFS transporter [Chryseobacterium indologenes]MBU3048854.1 MFS transporter [Chryseobacterium indologenes]
MNSSQNTISKKIKPNLSMLQIINMSMGFLGIQMAFGLQNGNASRILANLGADVHQLSWFWLVAPVTGLIVQPIIGHMGDNTWSPLGRRKPYFLIGAVLCSIGLVLLPNAASVTHMFAANALLLAVIFLAMMDASVNIAMEPFRALVGDMLPKHQGTIGFSVQTILIGIGAVLGSYLPDWLTKLGISNEAPKGFVADNVIYSFYIGAALLLIAILYTIITTREYSPQEFAEFENGKETEEAPSKFSDIFKDFATIPAQMKKLGIVQFFSWFALFTMWVFTTSALATHHMGLSPEDTHSRAFNDAGDLTGKLFGMYNLWAIPFAFLLTPIAKWIGKKQTHALALFCGGLGLISMYFIKEVSNLWISMVGLGFAWASILAMPYAMLIEVIPQKKMGVYMGIFNFFIVIPQIINGLFGGPVVSGIFGKQAMDYVVVGGICMLIGALVTMIFVKSENETPKEIEEEIQQVHF